MAINGTFRFHNVGQGLFYSGILSKKDGNLHSIFSVVYDCGTESSKVFLTREIDDFKLLLPNTRASKNKKLNLLVISHLHDDHVNGLEYLLKDVEVDTVIMPYTNDDLKLLARIENDSGEEFLQVFYADPVAWFVSKGVRRVLLLGAEEPKTTLSYGYIEGSEIYIENQYIIGVENIDETEVGYLKNKAIVQFNNFYWEFSFENLKLEPSKIKSYVTTVNEFKNSKHLTLEQIFKNKSLSKALKREVNPLFKDRNGINRTSVVMLHRPIAGNADMVCSLCDLCHQKYYDLFLVGLMSGCAENCRDCSTILTGDLEIKTDEELEIFDYGLSEDCRHLVMQYPHHGSEYNNLAQFISLNARVNVVTCGIANKHGHPDIKVLQALPNIVLVNERNSFDYEILVKQLGETIR